MTLARQERTANFKLALTTLLEAVGDYALAEVFFDPNAHPDILKTTWEDLEKIALIEPLPTGKYLPTGRGWTAALLTTAHPKRALVQGPDVLQIEIETDNLINESFEVDDFTQRFRKVCG